VGFSGKERSVNSADGSPEKSGHIIRHGKISMSVKLTKECTSQMPLSGQVSTDSNPDIPDDGASILAKNASIGKNLGGWLSSTWAFL